MILFLIYFCLSGIITYIVIQNLERLLDLCEKIKLKKGDSGTVDNEFLQFKADTLNHLQDMQYVQPALDLMALFLGWFVLPCAIYLFIEESLRGLICKLK